MKRLLFFILGLGLLLRVVGLASYPAGFTADEASFGYDAYSLLKTGKDQWGASWPLTLRSFGDFKLPAYTYLDMPFVAVLGLNQFSVRLPSALLGTLAILATFYMVKELLKNERVALASAALLAISPWHVSLSRGAFEANLTTFFMTFAVWAFIRGLKNKRYMMLSALSFGINLFTYHSARLVTPLVGLSLILLYKKDLGLEKFTNIGKVLKRYSLPLAIFLVFLGAAFYTLFIGGGARAADVTIFNPTDKWQYVTDRRYEAIIAGLPTGLARLFDNKIVYVLDQFVSRYLAYLSPQFLFTEGVSGWDYGMIPGRGVLYIIEVPFILMGLWQLAKGGLKKSKGLLLIVLWILFAPVAAALTKGPGYAGNRAAVMMPALEVFSAFGAVALFDYLLKATRLKKNLIKGIFIVSFAVFLGIFLEDYVYQASQQGAESMLYGRREAVLQVNFMEADYKEIIFSRSLTEPQIFVAFYTHWDPADYQKQTPDWLRYEKEGLPFLDQLGEYHLGKYTFKSLDLIKDTKIPNVLMVGKPEEFGSISPTETVYFDNGTPALYIVDPAKITTASL